MGKIIKDNVTVDVHSFKTNSNKEVEQFRNYTNSEYHERVKDTYRENHIKQTVEAVEQLEREVCSLRKAKMSLWEALDVLDEVVDESDPDTNVVQTMHLLQTGEAIRKDWPGEEYDWFHLTGFLHDVGKLLVHKKFYNLPQWAVVGDTFPVGCKFSKKNVFPEFAEENPDFHNPLYNSKYGMYPPNCGLDNVKMSFGHDEYFYQVCVQNGCKLPTPALYIIRYHSFYGWHHRGAYNHLTNEKDRENLKWVKEFQKYDLYSKDDGNVIDAKSVKLYYKGLIEKYFPQEMKW